MVILDTNVVSELMRLHPKPAVVAWLDARPERDLFVTAVTEAAVRTGIAFLPWGRRRQNLVEAAARVEVGRRRPRVIRTRPWCPPGRSDPDVHSAFVQQPRDDEPEGDLREREGQRAVVVARPGLESVAEDPVVQR